MSLELELVPVTIVTVIWTLLLLCSPNHPLEAGQLGGNITCLATAEQTAKLAVGKLVLRLLQNKRSRAISNIISIL